MQSDLDKLLAKANASRSATSQQATIAKKDLDALVTTDPWCLRMQDKGAVKLFDSSRMGLELSRVLVVREDAVITYARELRSLVSACLKRNTQTGLTDSAGQDAALRREGFTLEQWQKSLGRIRLPDAAENRRLMKEGGELEECLGKMIGLMMKQGQLQHEIKARALLVRDFLKEAS